jgi:hypothetical protein
MPASTSPLRQTEATSRWGASEYVRETIPTGMGRPAGNSGLRITIGGIDWQARQDRLRRA